MQGVPGTPGPALQFATGSGTNGPAISQAGTYFVDVEANIDNPTGSTLSGDCYINAFGGDDGANWFVGSFSLPTDPVGSEGPPVPGYPMSFTGMLVVPADSVPAQPQILCVKLPTQTEVVPALVRWWITRVSS